MKLLAVFAIIATLYAAPSRGMSSTASTPAESAPVVATVQASPAQVKRANALLAARVERYPLLDGVTVSFGVTPDERQAVAYYTSGHILIDPEHTASLTDIVDHEIWHVIDWRDNGRIDWEEQVPPNNSADYER